jgi:starvation-inducible DNA-binding protein
MSVNTGLTDTQRTGSVGLLKALLADEYVLYTKTRNYHWNVTGPHFHDLHKFFEAQYDDLDGKIDEIAEFIRALGEKSPGSLAEFLSAARLKEATPGNLTAAQMVQDLLANHETLARALREDIEKAGSLQAADVEDFLTGLLEDHQKMAWMLRALGQ